MKTIYIDANPTLLYKNSYFVSQFIKSKNICATSIYVSLESAYEDQVISLKSIENLSNNILDKFVCMPSYSPKVIQKYLKSEKPDYVVLCGYRVPDIVWLAVCNKLRIKTIYYQHRHQHQ